MPPTNHNPDITPEYSDLIMQMIRKNPAQRPENLHEVLSRLNRMKIFKSDVETPHVSHGSQANLGDGHVRARMSQTMSTAGEKCLPFEAPIYQMESRLAEMEILYAKNPAVGASDSIRRIRRELVALKRSIYANLTPWQTVMVSRHEQRPQTRDYLELVFDRFIELHGDRAVGDDQAMMTGLAHLGDLKVMVIGQQKGRNLAAAQGLPLRLPAPGRLPQGASQDASWPRGFTCRSSV